VKNEILIFIPTYNEKENLPLIIPALQELKLATDILVMDDGSPDGTGVIADQFEKQYENFKVIHRAGKSGIGSAHYEGISWAYEQGYKKLVTMDCDLTHHPHDVPRMLEQSSDSDVVVGSRFLDNNSLETWSIWRTILTKAGHLVTHSFLNVPYDATGAFRVYDLEKVNKCFLEKVTSRGYSFFFESLFVLSINKIKISEVAIELPARAQGHSKMSFLEIFKSIRFLFILLLRRVFNVERYYFENTSINTEAKSEVNRI
jgi:dolichol-phosphate mannosyltransferase